jgi:hypothetical protein
MFTLTHLDLQYLTSISIWEFETIIVLKWQWLVKHISTKVSFKITIRKRHVYINIPWSWIWNQLFYLGIWNDARTKMIILHTFLLATLLNSQNSYETVFHNEIWHINLYMYIGISNCHNWRNEPTRLMFLSLYHFFTRLLTSKHLKLTRT